MTGQAVGSSQTNPSVDELKWCETTSQFLATQNDFITADELRAFHALPAVPDGATYDQEIVYGTGGGRELRMLLYGRTDTSQRRPAILALHGGGWRSGTRLAQRRQAAEFAARGLVAGAVEYRFSEEAVWPAQLEDAKRAVTFLRANHAAFGADPDRIVIAGGSSGAHIAAMAALTSDGDGGHGDVQAAVLFSPAVDLTRDGAPALIHPLIELLLGGDWSRARDASPITHVHAGAPPILTLSGDADPATRIEDIRRFHAALDAGGVTNELVEYPGRMHGFGIHGPDFFDVVERTTSFIARQLGPFAR